jgi:hypothetical protein
MKPNFDQILIKHIEIEAYDPNYHASMEAMKECYNLALFNLADIARNTVDGKVNIVAILNLKV